MGHQAKFMRRFITIYSFNFKYSVMKFALQLIIYCIGASVIHAQNVGIGTSTPTEKLEVLGNIKGNNFLVGGFLGINNLNPIYRLHVNDGTLALTNSTDNITWTMSYSSASNYLAFAYNSAARVVVTNTGNVGINTTSPAHRLDVNGSLGASSAAIDGNLTVNDGHGILRNAHGSSQLKYYTFTGSFAFTNYAGHTVSGPHTVSIPAAAGFTSPPRVMIANYTYISGTGGHLFSIVPAIYSVDSNSFEIYFFNSSTNAATMNFTMSFVCIGN